ncbi:MAG: excinuclease ABC subunit UvrC [Clostridia bacterium]|nr:excinuclease ABC subunit UvrC [Clostridia bacterium]MBP7098752.1 excinuclease ABC subunit UvrC [Clostridia bacterium]
MKILRKKAMSLPLLPGVYIMKNADGEIIYIGKAKALKNRVSQYFGSQNRHPIKVRKMVENVDRFDYIVTGSEFEALVLECSLIKQHSPKYNILLKDDKGYSYIRISEGEYRKISAVFNKKDDGSEYIGPYLSSYSVRQSVDAANKIFKLPQCNKVFPRDFGKSRPCLNYYISQCCGLCTGKIKKSDYDEAVDGAIAFLKGDSRDIIADLRVKMEKAAEELDFEQAAKLRDRINSIERIKEKQKVVYKSVEEQDVFATADIDGSVCLAVLRFSNGRLFDSEHFFFDDPGDKKGMRSDFITSYYSMRDNIPKRVTVDGEVADRELLEQWLSEKKGKKVTVFVPARGEQLEIVNMCRKNAEEKLAIKKGRTGREIAVLDELKDLLGLKKTPEYIESYDISHTAGQDSVAGMIVFKGGKPYRKAYKRFSIKSFDGNDDYRAMNEVLTRRFSEYEKSKDSTEGFGKLPDLILLDGGVGQVHAVEPVLREFGLKIPLFGMVKDNRHRTRAISGDGGEIAINSKRQVFTLVSEIQNEVHRFSVAYHHQKHAKRGLSLSLTEIEGVGEKRASALLKYFKTMTAIKNAEVDELSKAPGITSAVAQNIYDYYRTKDCLK